MARHPELVSDPSPAPTVRVEKRKWDGTVSAVDTGSLLAVPGDLVAWLVRAGSRRQRPKSGATELIEHDELWLSVPGECWALCGYTDAARSLTGYKAHASAPFEVQNGEDEILWVDLDLDFDITDDSLNLRDEAEFRDHAHMMGYPADVVQGAWSGIATVAARYTTEDWPFDGSLQKWAHDA